MHFARPSIAQSNIMATRILSHQGIPSALPVTVPGTDSLANPSTSRRPIIKLLGFAGLAATGLQGCHRSVAAAATTYPSTPEEVLADPQWPESWPFKADDFH